MRNEQRMRIYMTGVGGQGTLTATTLLARVALQQGLTVVAGEVHGMAQRGGVVESVVLLGGWLSSKLGHGEADILLGFEPLETLRALPYLAPHGKIFSSTDPLPPVNVCLGKEDYPTLESIEESIRKACPEALFLPCRTLGQEAGSIQSGNTVLLGALCASGLLPIGNSPQDAIEAMEKGIRTFLPAKIQDANLKALQLGVAAVK